MTIYVDTAMIQATVPNGRRTHTSRWCHLMSDQLDPTELHAFAARIGLRRAYFQTKPGRPIHDHYDVTEGKRWQALRAGAVEIDRDGMIALMRRRRAALTAATSGDPA